MLNLSVTKEYKIEDRALEVAADLITQENYDAKFAFRMANKLLYSARSYPENASIVAEIIENKEVFDKVKRAIENIINHRAEEGPKEVEVDLSMNLNFSTKVPFNIYRVNEYRNETNCYNYMDEITEYFRPKIKEILLKVCEQNENISSIDLTSLDIDLH